jgi:hypothetical protein
MNLPGTAIEFLQYFVGFLNQNDDYQVTIDFPIFVHCYLFSKLSKDEDGNNYRYMYTI